MMIGSLSWSVVESELLRQAEIDEAERKVELMKQREDARGCSWGINEADPDEEGEEEGESVINPFATIETENEDLYINDPKKALNSYFEREGLDLPEYEFHEAGFGKWKCTIELPIDGPNGESLVAEAVVSGKRKDAVVACALEACRMLDRHGELRKSAQESRKKKRRNWEDDDFYDSDEDTFLDRTGTIEKKREMRKMKVGKAEQSTETYATLSEKHKGILEEIAEIEGKLEQAKAQAAAMETDDGDALDAYMMAIKSGMMDTKTKMTFKRQLMVLKQEEQKVRKLVNLAKPASMPELTAPKTGAIKTGLGTSVGKIKGPSVGTIMRKVPVAKPEAVKEKIDDDEDEEENTEHVHISEESGRDRLTESGSEFNREDKLKTDKISVKEPQHQNSENVVKNVATKDSANKVEKKSHRSKGHSLPLAAVLEKLQEEADAKERSSSGSVSGGGKRKGGEDERNGKKSKVGDGYSEDDPDYAVWLPPQGQSGDGKTHLNEKLGY